ncbi:MAG TPA: cytochrome c [Bryobacteraceae bacterium]|jgi:mono/diheme cytochrome c family protein|nr:cytochrome c [Bryobacteraceae bacterium]
MKFLAGFLIGIIILPMLGYFYFRLGVAPVATSAAPMPFEKRLAHMALNARIDKEAPKVVPIQASDDNYMAGVKIYRTHCAVCHGLPGQPPTALSKGMFPKPPELFKGKGVTDDPAGETYWKVANGIRLTGMPGFTGTLSGTEIWQVSLLLAHADKLPDPVRTVLPQPLQIQ